MTTHQVKQGIIENEHGIPHPPRWFADSRLAFRLDEMGITQIDYRNPRQYQGNNTLFVKRLRDVLRYFLEKDGMAYQPEYYQSRTWPFGITAIWNFQGALCQQRVLAIDETIVIELRIPPEIPANTRFRLDFWEAAALHGSELNDYNYFAHGMRRTWQAWKYEAEHNALLGGFVAVPESDGKSASESEGDYLANNPGVESQEHPAEVYLAVALTADFPLEHTVKSPRVPINARHSLRSAVLEGGKTYRFLVLCAPGQEELLRKNQELQTVLSERIFEQFERYEQVARRSPQLRGPYTGLNDFMSLAPLYHESLKITDHPGALRAKTTHYGVWGWDSLTANFSTAYWGDREHILHMLRFYEETAHPELGIGHSFGNDLRATTISAIPAQGMYITLLQLYLDSSGDLAEVKARYPFARKIFHMIVAREVGETGFCEGTSLYPDYPAELKETGHDISAFNNVIFYCAARSMEILATWMDDEPQRRLAETQFRKMEQHFISLFYDPVQKFIVTSVDAATLEKRSCYNLSALKWENHFCQDLLELILGETLAFVEQHALSAAGLREMALGSAGYDGDANQLHCWWPVNSEYFIQLANQLNRPALFDRWVGWVSYWTGKLMCPEAIPYAVETAEPELDNWNTLPGTWQAYSIRGWYQAAIHGLVGVTVDGGGLTFFPYGGAELTLAGLHDKGKIFDIVMKGSGPHVASIQVDQQTILGTHKLPVDTYRNLSRVTVEVQRTTQFPQMPVILSAHGVTLSDYRRTEDGTIRVKAAGAGTCRLKIRTQREVPVMVDHRPRETHYTAHLNLLTAELLLRPGDTQEVEIGA